MTASDRPGEDRLDPDRLDPYTVRAFFIAETEVADPAGMVSVLLEDIAQRCQKAGCSLVGHIKCHARMEESHFHCNLTSLRSGARCGGPGGEGIDGLLPLRSGGSLELDLAVLVYGLPSATLEVLVGEALAEVRPADGASASSGRWVLPPSGLAGSSEPDVGRHCHH
jgi:hypothetical protein